MTSGLFIEGTPGKAAGVTLGGLVTKSHFANCTIHIDAPVEFVECKFIGSITYAFASGLGPKDIQRRRCAIDPSDIGPERKA